MRAEAGHEEALREFQTDAISLWLCFLLYPLR